MIATKIGSIELYFQAMGSVARLCTMLGLACRYKVEGQSLSIGGKK